MTERQFLLNIIAEKGTKLAYDAIRTAQSNSSNMIATEAGKQEDGAYLMMSDFTDLIALLEILGPHGFGERLLKSQATDFPDFNDELDDCKDKILSAMQDARENGLITE
jgi:ABC-type branched-subunit amino acid transport system substrate-binding protein